jgi:CBS domain-containing protein
VAPHEAHIAHAVRKIPLLSEDTDITDAAIMMYEANTRLLPVERRGTIIGVIRALDVMHALVQLEEIKTVLVNDCKLVKVRVDPNDTIVTALRTMFEEHVDRLPVVTHGKIDAVITQKDILKKYHLFYPKAEFSLSPGSAASSRAFTANIPSVKELPVLSFDMPTDIQTVQPSAPLGSAVEMMVNKNINSIIVEENSHFVGMLSTKNILRKITRILLPRDFNIRWRGLQETHLEPYQIYSLYRIASQEAVKVQRGIHNTFELELHVKEYSREGKRHKYSVTMKLEFPGQVITSTQEDWDVETALRKTFNNAKNAVKKKFKGDQSRKKGYE